MRFIRPHSALQRLRSPQLGLIRATLRPEGALVTLKIVVTVATQGFGHSVSRRPSSSLRSPSPSLLLTAFRPSYMLLLVQPKQINEIKDFLITARRKDARCKCAASERPQQIPPVCVCLAVG